MPCKFILKIPAGEIDLLAPGDWWKTNTAILQVMGIADAGPVTDQAEAEAIAAKAVRAHQAARSGAAKK